MVILTCTDISVLYAKILNKFTNMSPFYHIKIRCRYQICHTYLKLNRIHTKRNEFTNEKFEMNIIHENVH